ncbi:acetate--CoA ligase [Methanolacinia petrolearia]|uniref:acetate--CoA ligase n=1 Tax=Methanolacinia petrolearia TaxID=54120 RepID=UPI00064F4AF0|nr:acetate--CoA ligase [Methanolacinia petrolearia]
MTSQEKTNLSHGYIPAEEYREMSNLGNYQTAYERFLKDPEKFWSEIASELEWFKEWDQILEWNYPNAKWFTGAKCNITHNCLDRHLNTEKRNKVALIWRGDDGSERIITYRQLFREVCRFANGLKSLGARKGDRICIYMPNTPEQIIAILACARIGAVHNVVFAGFGMESLHSRIRDSESRFVITSDASFRRGKRIDLKSIVDRAIVHTSVEKVIVHRRTRPRTELYSEIEIDFYDLMKERNYFIEPEVMDSEDPLFILYTSGTTGTAKGILHTCGGYMVGTYYTCKYVLDMKPSDVHWCTADPGWITGHSYIIYGPLLFGTTLLISETTPDYPDPGVWWDMVEDFGVTILYTAPTAIRMFMRHGEKWPEKYNLDSLRILASVGEPLNPEAFEWYYKVIGKSRTPIVDTWWQTETGMHMVTTLVGEKMKPGYAGKAIPGVVADVVDKEGNSKKAGETGILVIKGPWPSMMRSVWGNDERYRQYWTQIKDYYVVGDLAVKDDDGYIQIIGRSDDVIIIAGHNLGTAEVESALVEHEAVAEAAVIGIPDPVKGNIIKAFVILIDGYSGSEKLANELTYHVRMTLGPIAMPAEIKFVESLPKTRSGKIMRRVLKAQEMGEDPGDLSTMEE